jgi:ATP-binding cassette, subfamily F, member 3
VISVTGLAKAFGGQVLFRDVTITLASGRRTALVGNNGAGKTTLIEILMGEQAPDAGEIHRPKDVRIGYLPQELTEISQGSVLDTVLGGASEVRALEHKLTELTELLGTTTGAEHDRVLAEFGDAQHRFEDLGGYALEAEAQAILSGLGFAPDDGERPLRDLSGGWRMRAALAQLLLAKPDVLILDEPTNHLDTDSVTWLEDTLRSYPGAVLFVSHDRDFIDAIADRVVELAFQTAAEYVGGFAEFVVEREERLARLETIRDQQQREIARVERFVDRFRYKATKARQVQSRLKTLEKLERIEVPTQRELVARFAFPEPRRSSRVVAELEQITLGYDGVAILSNVELYIERGQKLGIVGPNGAGKTTLLRLLLGQLAPMTGTWKIGSNVDIATFAQHQVDGLDFNRTALQEIQTVAVAGERRNMRTVLGSFGFPGDMAERKVGDLSGGERTRLALAKALMNPVNLLILDEPTNHLDLASCDLLEDALRAYPGTVLLVSHDRYLIREVCDHLVAVRGGTVTMHLGVDEAVLSPRTGTRPTALTAANTAPPRVAGSAKTRDGERAASKTIAAPSNASRNDDRQEARKRDEAERRNARYDATKDLRKRIERLERDLGQAEAAVAELQRQLADPDVYGDNERVQDLVTRYDGAKDRAAELMETWVKATEELERIDARRS